MECKLHICLMSRNFCLSVFKSTVVTLAKAYKCFLGYLGSKVQNRLGVLVFLHHLSRFWEPLFGTEYNSPFILYIYYGKNAIGTIAWSHQSPGSSLLATCICSFKQILHLEALHSLANCSLNITLTGLYTLHWREISWTFRFPWDCQGIPEGGECLWLQTALKSFLSVEKLRKAETDLLYKTEKYK